jgi:hypothetical protein
LSLREFVAVQPKEQQAEADEKVLSYFASTSSAELNPMCAMFGGIVGQEAVKAISGKFTPITQWFYFDRCAVVSVRHCAWSDTRRFS